MVTWRCPSGLLELLGWSVRCKGNWRSLSLLLKLKPPSSEMCLPAFTPGKTFGWRIGQTHRGRYGRAFQAEEASEQRRKGMKMKGLFCITRAQSVHREVWGGWTGGLGQCCEVLQWQALENTYCWCRVLVKCAGQNHWQGLWCPFLQSWIQWVWVGSKNLMSNKHAGGAEDAGPGTTLWEPLL